MQSDEKIQALRRLGLYSRVLIGNTIQVRKQITELIPFQMMRI